MRVRVRISVSVRVVRRGTDPGAPKAVAQAESEQDVRQLARAVPVCVSVSE